VDTLKDYIYTMESCNSCGQCRFILGPLAKSSKYVEVCPVYARYLYESYSGQGLINIAQELLEGTLKYDDNLIKHIYTCTTCGACDVNCKSVRDMEVMDTILALRARCVEDGKGPLPEHRKLAELAAKDHNIYGKGHARRFDWLPENTRLSREASTAYFVGCSAAYLYPDIARDTIKILQAAGIDFKLLNAEEYCCGAPLWRTGQVTEAKKLAEHNLEVLKKQGIKTLVTSCAECYGTLKGFYPRIAALDFKVLHITEVLQQMLREGRLKLSRKLEMKVTYHDPCLLGRLAELYVPWKGEIRAFGYHDPPKKFRRGTNGVYEAPREILKAIPGLQLIEMPRKAENAFCCGGGGGVPEAFPDLALWTARERLNEAISTGAEAIVSGCPFCATSFRKAIAADQNAIHYHDLTELAAKVI
jgi:Fe-S oxidoreductase